MPDGTTPEQVSEQLDKLLIGSLREDLKQAFVLSKDTSMLNHESFDPYLEDNKE